MKYVIIEILAAVRSAVSRGLGSDKTGPLP
jgi:hypothetical protein